MSRWFQQHAIDYLIAENISVCQPEVVIRLDDIESFSPHAGGTICNMASGARLFIAGDHNRNLRMIVHREQPR